MASDELRKLKREFMKMTPEEHASIAKAMLEGAVKYVRRKEKAGELAQILRTGILILMMDLNSTEGVE